MVNRRALIFGLLALALGLGGAYLNYEWLTSQTRPGAAEFAQNGDGTVEVVTANSDLSAAESIRDLHLEVVEWPAAYVPQGAFHDPKLLHGRVSRRAIAGGEPILEAALLPAGSRGGLSPIIAEGKRAVAVRVDEVIGIAGFVKPGANVDVLATIRDRSRSGNSFTKVILQDVKVLAIDQNLERTGDGEPTPVNVVTLEVTPDESQKLAYAAHEGKLQLALRNPVDAEQVSTRSVSANQLYGTAPRSNGHKRTRVEVIKGLDVSRRTF